MDSLVNCPVATAYPEGIPSTNNTSISICNIVSIVHTINPFITRARFNHRRTDWPNEAKPMLHLCGSPNALTHIIPHPGPSACNYQPRTLTVFLAAARPGGLPLPWPDGLVFVSRVTVESCILSRGRGGAGRWVWGRNSRGSQVIVTYIFFMIYTSVLGLSSPIGIFRRLEVLGWSISYSY